MDTVLGLSVTATNVQTVLVEGRDGDGATLGHDEFAVFTDDVAPTRASEQVAEAVLSIASSDGHRLHSIGVTWSDDADLEASLLLDTLADMGLANVVAVQSPRAAEALARNIGRMIGYERTAVCVVEPGSAILSLVDTVGGDVETFVSHDVENDDLLLNWLSAILGDRDSQPEAMFVVGSVGGLDSLAGWLEQELGVPVFDPPEAELALAHGAALASASDPAPATAVRTRRLPAAPVAMLIAGAVTFVVSVSVAVSSQLTPHEAAVVTDTQDTKSSAVAPEKPRTKPVKPASAAPPPPPEAPPAPVEQAPPPVVEAPPAPVIEAPAPAPVEQAPAPVYEPPVVEAPAPAPVYEAPAPPPEAINQITPPPPVVAPVVPQVPYEKPRLRDRILDKIPGLNRFAN